MSRDNRSRAPKKNTISLQLEKVLDTLQTTEEGSEEEDSYRQGSLFEMATKGDKEEKEVKQLLLDMNATINITLEKMQSMESHMETSMEKLSQKIDNTCSELKELKKQNKEFDKRLKSECVRIENDYNKKFKGVKDDFGKLDEIMEEMEKEIKEIVSEIKSLKQSQKTEEEKLGRMTDKCLDLESRTRRYNLRILGVKEGREGHESQACTFVTDLLKDVFELSEEPRIDVANRVGYVAQGKKYSRQIIVKFRDISSVEFILKKIIHGKKLTYRGDNLRIFRDYSPEVVQKMRLFTPARHTLRDVPGVRYGIYFPGKMKISYNGVERSFAVPGKALNYAEDIAKKTSGQAADKEED